MFLKSSQSLGNFAESARQARSLANSSIGMTEQNLGLGFLQKDDVGIGVAAQDAEILAIRRPVE